jgi:heat shock protein HslJ
VWKRTDFNQGQTTTPDDDDRYSFYLERNGKIEARANCGRYRGKATLLRQSITLEFDSVGNTFRRTCRKDRAFQLFIGDLEMARELELDGDLLRLTHRDGSSVMTFQRR